MPDTPSHSTLEAVSAARWRIAILLTIAMMVVYFGFILLVAFNKPLLAARVAPGLSLGILLGALVIIVAWALTWIYIRWANMHYDNSIRHLRPAVNGGRGQANADAQGVRRPGSTGGDRA
ncbi:Inner membrane protein YjcH [compost metagenome]